MKIIVKESQYRKLILEERKIMFEKKLENMKNFFGELSENIKNQIGLDLTFLSTWGVTIAGFVKPVQDFIANKFDGISPDDLVLMSVGLILVYYQNNKEKLKRVLDEIKERNLVGVFEDTLKVGERLRNVFVKFIESLAIPTLKYSNILAYTFIIPLIGDLFNLVQGESDMVNPIDVVKRIGGYIVLNLSGEIVKRILLAIVRRFKS